MDFVNTTGSSPLVNATFILTALRLYISLEPLNDPCPETRQPTHATQKALAGNDIPRVYHRNVANTPSVSSITFPAPGINARPPHQTHTRDSPCRYPDAVPDPR